MQTECTQENFSLEYHCHHKGWYGLFSAQSLKSFPPPTHPKVQVGLQKPGLWGSSGAQKVKYCIHSTCEPLIMLTWKGKEGKPWNAGASQELCYWASATGGAKGKSVPLRKASALEKFVSKMWRWRCRTHSS